MAQIPDPSIEGRVVVLTGGGRGLGQVMALALVEAGANVTGARSSVEIEATVAMGEALIPGPVGGRAKPFVPGKAAPGSEGFVDGLLPPEIMAPPILWLASSLSDGVTGRRYVARDWDADLDPLKAAARAQSAPIDWPHVT